MKIYIQGVEREFSMGTLDISEAIEERSTSSFSLIDPDGNMIFNKGDKVEIKKGADTVFGGVLEDFDIIAVKDRRVFYNMQCIDWHYLADKRIIAKAYKDITCGVIIRDIVTNILSNEGIKVGKIDDGALLTEAVFNYTKASKALETLADKSNCIWYIDAHKNLYFISRKAFKFETNITNDNVIEDSVKVRVSSPMYRNKQYIKGGKDITDPLTQKFKGDGENQTFTVGFPIAKVPTVKLNNVVQAIGIRGLDENKQWYWSKGDNFITQEQQAIAIKASDTLEVTYQGEFDIVVITHSESEISNLAAREGTTGIVEEVEDDVEIRSRDDAFKSANAKLQKYGVIGRQVSFKTWVDGIKSGQVLIADFPQYNLNNVELLVEGVTITFENNTYFYDVRCAEGPEQLSWTKLFERIATRGQAFVVRENISENQVLVTLAQFSKDWDLGTNPNIYKEVYAATNLYPSTSLYPMFAADKRIRYIELLDSNNKVLCRKEVTKQVTNASNMLTTVYIAPFESNGQISKIRFYGGYKATEGNGTGIMISEHSYSRLKTELEAIHVEKTDNKLFSQTIIDKSKPIAAEYMQSIDNNIENLLRNSV